MTKSKATSLKPIACLQNLFTNAPEDAYTASVAESHRKKLGQFFTPVPVAEFMAKWITANPSCHTILDPAIGLGMFFRIILKVKQQNTYKFVGHDTDPTILRIAKSLLTDLGCNNVELKNTDYLFDGWSEKYDGVICNPPYFKFQDYKNRAASLEELQTRLGFKLSGFTNIYTMFMLKSVSQLSENGRAAYLVPFEFLNSDYGTSIKKHLLESGTLRHAILFNPNEHVFNNALTTSCILLFANDSQSKLVTFADVHKVEELQCLSEQLTHYPNEKINGKVIHQSDLNPNIKWRAYYQNQNGQKFKELVPLSSYGKVVRGIATGDNDYFTFDEKKKAEFGIKDKFLLSCLTKATHANSSFFTQKHFDDLHLQGSKIFLLNATDLTNEALKRYIELGEKLKVNERYLTKHRTPWHSIENRPPAPILVTVFNRSGLRFVRNETNVRNLTSFHAFYPNLFSSAKLNLLMAYFLTDLSKEIINDNRREYGGGLNKFEPNDLNKSSVINLEVIDSKTEGLIREAYESYRASVLSLQPDVKALGKLNSLFLAVLK
jgi:adenine-specific DNA-methyltransferase